MKTFAYIICYFIYPFSFLWKRNSRHIVFGSYRGGFSDNSKYLFIYTAEHYPKLDICWLSINRKTVERVRSLGLPAYWVLSPAGAWKALRAKYWFVNSYSSDIMFCLSGGATIVNLWHGVGLKRCEFNIRDGVLAERFVRQSFYERFYHPENFRRPDYVVSSTEFQSRMFASAFRIPLEKCLNIGYPRNGILQKPKEQVRTFVERYEPIETLYLIDKTASYDKVYIYMPTWRDSQREVFVQHFDLERLNQVLVSQHALMLLKPHPNTVVSDMPSYSNIILVDGKVDVYGILPFTDVLITDYSSILYDYLLMPDKQTILFLYDYDDYVHERDFYYPFDENVVGKIVTSFDELLETIKEQDYNIVAEQQQKILSKFWGDTMNQKDVCDNILKYLKLT